MFCEFEEEMTGVVVVSPSGCKGGGGGGGGVGKKRGSGEEERERERQQLSVLEVLLAAVRRSVVACRVEREGGGGWGEEGEAEAEEGDAAAEVGEMEIGWPTDVRHVAHVTFDRFHGFLGLPVEFEVEMPCRVPSAR